MLGRLAVRRAGARRADDVRRRRAAPCCRRAAPSRASSRCAARWPRASRPTAAAHPDALADALRRIGARRERSPASSSSSPTSATRTAGRARSARCARATRCSRSRSRDPREARSPRSGGSRWSTRRPARASRSTPRAARARALRRARARAPRAASRASCGACASSTCAVDRRRLAAQLGTAAAMSFALAASGCSRCCSSRWRSLRASRVAPARAPLRRALPRGASTLARAAGAVPAWRRHLPAALAARGDRGARARAGQAAAHRRASRSSAASIMLVTDHSRSMLATDVDPTRLAAAQRAAHRVPRRSCPRGVRVGVVAFSDAPDAAQAPTPDHDAVRARSSTRRSPTAAPPPATRCRSRSTLLARAARHGQRPPARRSCCCPTARRRPAATRSRSRSEAARAEGPDLHRRARHARRDRAEPRPFARRCPVPPDPETLAHRRRTPAGALHRRRTTASCRSIYKTLGSQLGTQDAPARGHGGVRRRRPVLLLGAAAASTALGGRGCRSGRGSE